MKPEPARLLARSDVAALLGLDDCMVAVERAFAMHADGTAAPPGVLGVRARDGAFHVKAGALDLDRSYFVTKVNANFPHNPCRHGLPLIQGVIVLCDGATGVLLALMDSAEITVIRTGAATGVAAKYLARKDAKVVTICGCGNQGRVSLRALSRVRALTRAHAFDLDEGRAQRFAEELTTELGIAVDATTDLTAAVRESDVCVTCTPSNRYYLRRRDVAPGTFVAAVGADSEEKQELEPALLAASKVVADVVGQCATIGELHHAVEQGLMTPADVHAELGEVITGRKIGRAHDDEIIVFDSTGMALQDVAAAAIVYERAVRADAGTVVSIDE